MLQTDEPGICILEGLLLYIEVRDNLLVVCIHEVQQAAILMKISSIVNQISDLRVIKVLFGDSSKPIILDAMQFGGTIS